VQSALATYHPHPAPVHTKGKELGEEITEMCAYIYAATYQLLVMKKVLGVAGPVFMCPLAQLQMWHWHACSS